MSTDLYHVSPSQLVTYIHGCARAWAFNYIWGLKPEGNKYSDLGHAVHKVGEDWILEGKVPDFLEKPARIFKPALNIVPPPQTIGLFAEELVLWDSPRGNRFKFLRDLYLPYLEPGVAYIWDYKSTSNLSYAHTKEELEETDPQGLTYAAQLFLDDESPFEPLHTVKENWIYLPTAPPHKAHPVLAEHKKDTCLARFDLLDQTAGVMLRHRQLKTHPLAFEPKAHHCGAFGGCPFKGRECQLSMQEEIIAMSAQAIGANVNAFLSSVRRNNEAPSAGPTPGEQAPMIVSTASPMPALPSFLQNPAAQAALPAPAPTIPTAAAPQPAQLPWLAQAAPVAPVPVVAAPVAAPVIPELQVQPVVSAAPPSSAPAPADPPKKRTRRTKAEMEAARQQAQQNGTVIDPELDEPYAQVDEEGDVVLPNLPPTKGAPDSYEKVCLSSHALLERVVIAMTANPGYCALDSVALVDKAKAIVAAVVVEG